MAELEIGNPIQSLKNTKIVVSVEEALEDLLVVSFTCGTTSFQGVLLNSNKRNWPLGIMPPDAPFPGSSTDAKTPGAATEPQTQDSDKLYTVCRRYTYFQGSEGGGLAGGNGPGACILMPRRTYCRRFGDRTARTMRLRPRQVLCSKCKSICNENSENVEVANTKREVTHTPEKGPDGRSKLGIHGQVTTGGATDSSDPPCLAMSANCPIAVGARMVLRKRRLVDDDAASILRPVVAADEEEPSSVTADASALCKKPRDDDEQNVMPILNACPPDESRQQQQQPITKTSPFIKISFGPQGTVLKIPPRTHNYTASDNEVDLMDSVLENSSSPAYKHARAKAARKALKKAKKDAQKKVALANSPLRTQDGTLLDSHKSRHHKHKFKHKRKHQMYEIADAVRSPASLRTKHYEGGAVGCCNGVSALGLALGHVNENHIRRAHNLENEGLAMDHRWDTSNGKRTDRAYSDIKKECLRQKLSISLKRLSEKSYMKCSPVYGANNNNNAGANAHDDSNGSGLSNHSDSNSNSEAGDLPDFPESELPNELEKVRPLMMRISSYNVGSCSLLDGRTVAVGDVVWGKVHGFPWWPGRVLSISVSQRDNGMLVTQQAHVAWFGSSTSSHMPCNQLVPFLEDFKVRYNKKKRGPYKEAIKQATLAAQQVLRSVGIHT